MVSTTNVWENTEMPMFGKFLPNFLTTCLWLQLSRTKYSVFMVDFLQVLTLLTKFDNLTEFKKYHMKVQSAIYYGLILTIVVVGVFHQEVQAIVLDKIFQSSSTTLMDLPELQEPISWWWMDTTGHMNAT